MRKIKKTDICNVLFESAVEGMTVVDSEGTIQMVNPRVTELFGYESKELVGQPVEILIPDQNKDDHSDYLKKYMTQPSKRFMGSGRSLKGKRKDESTFPVDISLTHFEIKGQLMVMALISDATRSNQLYNESKKNVRFLTEAEELAHLGHYEIDMLKRTITWSKGTYNIFGITPLDKTITFREFTNMIHKEDRNRVIELYKSCIKEHRTFDMTHRIRKADGNILFVHSIGYVNDKDDNGNPTKIFGIIQNVSSRKKVEDELQRLNTKLEQNVEERTKELKESQQLYKMIARNFPNGMISVFDKNLNYVFAEGMELYRIGITSEELIGTNYLERLPEEIREATHKKLMVVFKAKNCSFEIETNNKTYLINAVSFPDNQGEINRILVVEQNITRLKKAEEDTRKALKKEKFLSEFKSRFVSMASHEFRTPLTSILSSITLLSKYVGTNNTEKKQEKHINRIKSSIHYLTTILNDFLALDKLEAGKMEIYPTEFNLPELSLEIAEENEEIAKKGQTISYEHTGKVDIRIDKQMLKNIFYNLLSNAVKYSPENSHIEFRTSYTNGNLLATVKDQGIGIPIEEQNHLFERFFRAKNALNTAGTGLGLNIVKKYVDLAGGKISFKSNCEEGTTFEVKLPIEN